MKYDPKIDHTNKILKNSSDCKTKTMLIQLLYNKNVINANQGEARRKRIYVLLRN